MKKLILKSLLFLLLIANPCYAQQGLSKIRINDFSGGMVSNSIADILESKQAASVVNVVLSKPGEISKRKGQGLFLKDVGSTPFVGIGRFDPDATTSYLVAASGVNIIRATTSANEWTVANPASPLTAGQNTEFVQANDLLFVLNGFDNTAWYNGSNWVTATGYPTSPPTARTGAWLRNYLFLAGGTTENDWIYFSNNLQPTIFDASDVRKVNTGDGQKIQRILPFKENELIVYKERSIFVLDITGAIADWTIQPISTVVGTIAPRSVVSLGNDQWFLSSNPIAIRSLVRSSFDKILIDIVSKPLQDIFDGSGGTVINTTHISKAAAILFDNKYLLAIPTGTSTVNNTVLVYDFITQGWSIIYNWYPAEWEVFDNRLFYIDANDGRVIECFTGNYGDWAQGPNFIDSASLPTVATGFDYISKALDFDSSEDFKQLDSIEVEFNPTGNYWAVVYVNLDNQGWASVGSVNLAANGLTLPFSLPSTLGDSGLARKTFSLSDQGEFKKMQVRVRQDGLNQKVNLQRITVFADKKPWRRDNL